MIRTDKIMVLFILSAFFFSGVYASEEKHRPYMDLYEKALNVEENIPRLMEVLRENRELLDDLFIEAMIMEGDEYYSEHEIAEAVINWKISAAAYEIIGEKTKEAETLLKIGEALLKQRNPGISKNVYQRAYRLAKELGDERIEGESLLGLAEVSLLAQDPFTAKESAEKSLEISRRLNRPVLAADNLRILGITSVMTGNLHDARLFFEESLLIARRIDDLALLVRIYPAIARTQFNVKNYTEALETLDRLSAILKEKNDLGGYAKTLQGQGLIHMKSGGLEEAEAKFNEAREIFKNQKMHLEEADCILHLAQLQAIKKDFNGAIEYFQVARFLYNQSGAVHAYLETLLWLMFMNLTVEKYDIAEGYALEAAYGFEALDFNPGCFIANMMLDGVYQYKKDKETAEYFRERARYFLQEAGKTPGMIEKLNDYHVQFHQVGRKLPHAGEEMNWDPRRRIQDGSQD